METTDSAGKRSVRIELLRPMGLFRRSYNEESPEWKAFHNATLTLCSAEWSVELTPRLQLLKITAGRLLSTARLGKNCVIVTVQRPEIKLSALKDATAKIRMEVGDRSKAPVRVVFRSLDPGVELNTTVSPSWHVKSYQVADPQEMETVDISYIESERFPLEAKMPNILPTIDLGPGPRYSSR